MGLKKTFVLILILFLASTAIRAEELIFSGTPAAGKEFLCTFTARKNISRKMEIKGAKEPPMQVQHTEFSLNGNLLIKENSSKVFAYQFTVDAFSWLENAKKQTAADFAKVKIDVVLDAAGMLRLCRVAPDQHPGVAAQVPKSLQIALLQLGRSLRSNASGILGPDSKRKIGEFWTADKRLIQTLAKNRGISKTNETDWDSKVLFTRQENFLETPVNRVEVNLFTTRIPGYDCRLNMTYLFPVKDPQNTGAISYLLDWMECSDKIMPEDNPIFSGTKIIEITTMTIRRDLIPLNK